MMNVAILPVFRARPIGKAYAPAFLTASLYDHPKLALVAAGAFVKDRIREMNTRKRKTPVLPLPSRSKNTKSCFHG